MVAASGVQRVILWICSWCFVCALAVPCLAFEKGTKEFGFDGSFSYFVPQTNFSRFGNTSSENLFLLEFPSRVRLGFFFSDSKTLEFSPVVQAVLNGDRQQTSVGLAVGVGFHWVDNAKGIAHFVQPEVRFVGDLDLNASELRIGIGLEYGIKKRIVGSFGSRTSITFKHLFENGNHAGYTIIGLSYGISFMKW